ncbi:tRNA pseudouridine(38-40) synthase TruA [Dethiobacter alkaliphilus]|uniref:tRNA pseudouridine(38-40) synthase TruA n=1 Tax=Dethiobacter alkaliphilus TaxID=427926 RepID=UPI002227C678|nr:tRNA pseudouridine(38-40) synthase TruA [Dethiobacter alkaliphilus]MCW3491116.1 tRNA pseudouridine(38-40) synthase TruA [Dethiobacter alkaliphilus]
MPNIKLTLGYDGTGYHGFQLQKNAVTVQQKLEEAIEKVMGQKVRITASGRTDTGVHATGQVINFYAQTSIPPQRIPHALNAVLPRDIVIYAAEIVSDSFHARFDAVGKTYTYTIDNGAHPQVLSRHHAYHVRFPLDANLMKQAAAILQGKHDFTSFMASGSSVKTTVRNLYRLDVATNWPYITITAAADGFLYNMVRIIAGTLIEVGRGKRDPNLGPVIDAKNRHRAGWTVPAHGLVLREVEYNKK